MRWPARASQDTSASPRTGHCSGFHDLLRATGELAARPIEPRTQLVKQGCLHTGLREEAAVHNNSWNEAACARASMGRRRCSAPGTRLPAHGPPWGGAGAVLVNKRALTTLNINRGCRISPYEARPLRRVSVRYAALKYKLQRLATLRKGTVQVAPRRAIGIGGAGGGHSAY